jgi:hypothetical protein
MYCDRQSWACSRLILQRSLSACEDEDAEHTDEHIFDVRVIVHDYSDDSDPRKECGSLSYDVTPVEEQLPRRVKAPVVNLRGGCAQKQRAWWPISA